MQHKYLANTRLSLGLFFAVWSLYALACMTKNCYSAAMAAIVSEGVLTKSQTGLITAAFYLSYAVFQIVGGAAADRFSPDKLILVGVIGAATANLVIYFNQSYTVMMITWILNGAVQFGIWPSIFKIVSSSLAKEHRRRCIFFISTASSVGMTVSYIVAALIYKWQDVFLISAILLYMTALGWLFICRYLEGRMIDSEDDEKAGEKQRSDNSGLWRLLLQSGLILFFVTTVFRNMLDSGIKALTPVMITESYEHISPSLATGINTIIIISGILGLYITRLLFPKRVRDEASALTLHFAAVIPLVLVITMIGKVSMPVVFAALSLIVMFTSGSGQYTMYISVRFGSSGNSATVAGIFNAAAALGIVVANYGFAKIADVFGWIPTVRVWIALAVVSLALCAAAIPVWRKFLKSV